MYQMKFKAAAVQALTQLPNLAFGSSIKTDRFGDPQQPYCVGFRGLRAQKHVREWPDCNG